MSVHTKSSDDGDGRYSTDDDDIIRHGASPSASFRLDGQEELTTFAADGSRMTRRKQLIDREIDRLCCKAGEVELDKPMRQEGVKALKIAAYKMAYKKKYYDSTKDKMMVFPSVVTCLFGHAVYEEAEKYYYDEHDAYPLKYMAALRNLALAERSGLDDEESVMDEEDLEKLAMECSSDDDFFKSEDKYDHQMQQAVDSKARPEERPHRRSSTNSYSYMSPRQGSYSSGLRNSHKGSAHSTPSPADDGMVTPKSHQRRLSSKLAERFSRFEGDCMSPVPPAIAAILEVSGSNSDTDLSPMKLISGHKSNNNYPPENITLSAATRKRTIGDSLKGRVQAFDVPKARAAKILLSPQEVRQLIASSSTRIMGIKQNFEQQRQRVRDNVSKKERQRKLLLQINSEERRQRWKATRAAFAVATGGGLPSLGYNGASDVVNQDVHARQFDFSTFVPPIYGDKTDIQRKLILQMVDRSFVFTEFRLFGRARTKGSIEALIAAFQPETLAMGQVLWHQAITDGKNKSPKNHLPQQLGNEDVRAFYIVEEGIIAFHSDGVGVGTIPTGYGFGEQSLMYPAPSTVTVSVALDSKNQQGMDSSKKGGAHLLKLDPHVYRGLLHMYSNLAALEKRQVLLQVDFLKEILIVDGDDEESRCTEDLLQRLASIMTRVECTQDQVYDAPEDVTFFVIQSGEMSVRNSSGALNTTLKAGDYFGERALIGSLPRRSLVTTQTTMKVCSLTGVFFKIDRAQMEIILGPRRLQNLKDIHRLLSTSTMSLSLSQWKFATNSKVSPKSRTIADMADKIVLHKLEAPNKMILTVKVKDKPAVYVVQEGTVQVSFEDGDGRTDCKTLKEGDVFGHEQIKESKDSKGSKKILRTGGLTVQIKEGTAATIGVLEFPSIGIDSSCHTATDASPIPSASPQSSAGTVSSKNSTLALRDKIRQVVKNAITLADLEKLSLLGEGEFGEVWLVAADIFQTGDPSLRQKFALKSQRKVDELRGKDAVEAIRREIDIMKDLSHSQVVDLVQTFEDEDNLYMLMGLIPGGELWDRVYQESGNGTWTSGLSEEHAKFYSLVIADTLGFIHSRKYIYRDLKPENVMIDADGYPVIVDFGCSKYCPDTTFTFCGTPNYVSPEIIKNAGHNRCVDYWALGITIYEMITGENPFYFDGMDQVSLYDCICQEPHYALKTDKGHSTELIDLVDRLLEKDPTDRLGMLAGGIDDILHHTWFDALSLHQIRTKQWPAPWKPERNEEDVSLAEGLVEQLGLGSIMPMPLVSTHSSYSGDNKVDMDGSFASLAEEVIPEDEELDGSGSSLQEMKPSRKPKRPNKATKNKKKSESLPIFSGAQLAPDFKYVSATSDQKIVFMENPKKKMTAEKRRQSMSRRLGIMDSLAGMGINSDDEFQLI